MPSSGSSAAWEVAISVSTREVSARLEPFPAPGTVGIFTPAEVRIETGAGDVCAARQDPVTDFSSVQNDRGWDDLQLLYHTGYSFWNYLTAPFLLAHPGVEVRDGGPWTENERERWHRVEIAFPPSIPTHSPSQTYYFDDDGLVRRVDYTASFLGATLDVAHYCADHRVAGGVPVPRRRWVVPRRASGKARTGPVMLSIAVRDAWLG